MREFDAAKRRTVWRIYREPICAAQAPAAIRIPQRSSELCERNERPPRTHDMKRKAARSIFLAVLLGGLVTSGFLKAAGSDLPTSSKTIRDRAEYNSYMAALNTGDAKQKADAMEAFINQYPNSVVKIDAMEQAMAAYQQLGNLAKVRDTAKRILQLDPDQINALAVVTLIKRNDLTGSGNASAAKELGLDGERGLNDLATWKPENVSDAEFDKVRNHIAEVFYGAVAFSALQARDYARAREYYLKSVPLNTANLPDVYQLSVAELEMTPTDPNGFWYAAKAINLARAQNNQTGADGIEKYAKAKYQKYHGTADGWDKIVASAENQSGPPPDFAASIKPASAESSPSSIASAASSPAPTPPPLAPELKKAASQFVGKSNAADLIKLDSKDPNEYLKRGDAAYESDRYDEAIANFNRAIELDPKNSDAYLKRASAKEEKLDADGSLADCNRAIELNPKNSAAYGTRALAKANKGNFDGAMADANRAIDLNSKSADPYNDRCLVEIMAKQFESALADADRAIELEPKNPMGYQRRANAKENKGDYDGAIQDINQLIALVPNNARAHGILARLHNEKGEWDAAVEAANRAIQLAPRANYYNERAVAESYKGDSDLAIADYTKAIELDTTKPGYYRNRANVEYAKGNFEGALADYTKAIEIDPRDAASLNDRAVVKSRARDFDGAISDATRAIELDPKRETAYRWRAIARIDKEDLKPALADLDEAIRLDPKDGLAYYLRGVAKDRKKDFAGAIEDYKRAIELNPKDGNGYSGLGEAKAQLGDVQGGLADCNRGVELSPKDSNVYNDRGLAEEEAKDFSKAVQDFSKAIELEPDSGLLYSNRAQAYINEKRYLDALTDSRRAVELLPNAYTWEVLGDVYIDIDRYSEAVDAYEHSHNLNSTPTILQKLGQARTRMINSTVAAATPPPAPTSAPSYNSTQNYYGEQFPETRTRILSYQELSNWSESKLRYAINEIFARHGATFTDPKITQQFSKFSWYHPNRSLTMDQIENGLPLIEKANVTVLGQARTSRLHAQSRRR